MSEKIEEFGEDSLKDIAKEIVMKRTALQIHTIIYIVINLLLAIINAMAGDIQQDPWFLWVVTGWGVGLAIHFLYYIVFKRGMANYSTIALIYHAFIYVIVNALLFFIDWFTTRDQGMVLDFVLYSAGFWGLGLIGHLAFYLYFRPQTEEKQGESWMERQVKKEMEKIQKK
jgi:hypothetical protein